MNCKPGDLAVIVRARKDPRQGGKLVRIIALFNKDAWVVYPPIVTAGHKWMAVSDANLRPIRDPGDDARDETLDWLSLPIKEVA